MRVIDGADVATKEKELVMAESIELLFFDTFSHESSEELNLDLVQFPKPVFISEVRIIPLGARVQADFPGGVRLGATNPSQFEIEFFVNDLSKPGASTFESLGGLEYKQNVNIQLECDRRIPTDGLVLRGLYTTITLAVYGVLTKTLQETIPPAPAPPITTRQPPSQPPTPSTPSSSVVGGPRPEPRVAEAVGPNTAATAEWVQQHAQVADLAPPVDRAYLVETAIAGGAADPYTNSYTTEPYHQPEYSHPYRDEWSQPQPTADVYDGTKELEQHPTHYDTEPLPWERTKDKEWGERGKGERDARTRERHRGGERDGDGARHVERVVRGAERDLVPDREWEERGRDRKEYGEVPREREWGSSERTGSGWTGSGAAPGGTAAPNRREGRSWERGEKRDGLTPPPPPHHHHHRHHHHDEQRVQRRGSSPESVRRGGSWERRGSSQERGSSGGEDTRKRPRSPPLPPPSAPPPGDLVATASGPKRPRTPPTIPVAPAPSLSPHDSEGEVRKEVTQPLFESLSPGDVESISEGEIPEADEDDGQEGPIEDSRPPPDDEEDEAAPKAHSLVGDGGRDEPMSPMDVGPSDEPHPAEPLPVRALCNEDDDGGNAVDGGIPEDVVDGGSHHRGSPALDGDVSGPMNSLITDVASPASGSGGGIRVSHFARGVSSLTPSPVPPAADEPEEQYEPILSDEEVMDEGESQYQDMEFDVTDYCEELSKTFNPYSCELQPLLYLSDPSMTACEAEEWRQQRRGCRMNSSRGDTAGGQRGEMVAASSSTPGSEELRKLEELFSMQAMTVKSLLVDEAGASGTARVVDQMAEEWVEAAEQVPGLLTAALPCASSKEEIMDTLVNWVLLGLDFEVAFLQLQPGYKIRHIKAGVRLVQAICSCGESYIDRIVAGANIHRTLLSLYNREYMALSIKLMILRAIDATFLSPLAVEKFLGRGGEGEKEETCYQILLNLIQTNRLARLKFALSSLLRKLHLYETLLQLSQSVQNLVSGTNMQLVNGSLRDEQFLDKEEWSALGEEEVATACLEEVQRVFTHAKYLISQPKRFLPLRAQFEVRDDCTLEELYKPLYAYFRKHRLAEACLVIVSRFACSKVQGSSASNSAPAAIIRLLSEMLESWHGMQYLCSRTETTNALLRVLMQTTTPDDAGPNMTDSVTFNLNPNRLGFIMAHRLRVFQQVDALLDAATTPGNDPDHTDVLESLHGLYSIASTPAGKCSVAHVLTHLDDAIALLLKLEGDRLDNTGDGPDVHLRRKSPGRSYAGDLLALAVRHSDYAPFLLKFGKEIAAAAARNVEHSRLAGVGPWLRPVESGTTPDLASLCEGLRIHGEHASNLPGELVTILRLLAHMALTPAQLSDPAVGFGESNSGSDDPEVYHVELRYTHALLGLFSEDGVPHLCNILMQVCDLFEQPGLHTTRLVSPVGAIVAAIALPALQLLRRMLERLIQARAHEFHDLTAIPMLLRSYTLLQSFPTSSIGYAQAQRGCREIIEALVAYTQPPPPPSSAAPLPAVLTGLSSYNSRTGPTTEPDGPARSLWTRTIAEILTYLMSVPHAFIPGLRLLSELLPLPLPIPIGKDQNESTLTADALNARRLWSVHLQPLASTISEVVATLSGSSFAPLLQLLRRVCIQIADLSPATALVITRALLDSLLSALSRDVTVGSDNRIPVLPIAEKDPYGLSSEGHHAPPPAGVFSCSGHTARLLNFLACLTSHGPIKVVALQLIRSSSSVSSAAGGDDWQYSNLVAWLVAILRPPPPDTISAPQHLQAQECAVSVLQCLCDTEVGLIPPPRPGLSGDSPAALNFLASCLPPKDLTLTFTSALVEHVRGGDCLGSDQPFAVLLPAVRTLLVLMEHDYGFYHLKSCLEKSPDTLYNLFTRCLAGFSKDNSDCLSTLSSSLELLRVLVSTESGSGGEGPTFPRTLSFSVPKLARLLEWEAVDANLGSQVEPKEEMVNCNDEVADAESKGEAEENASLEVKAEDEEMETMVTENSQDTMGDAELVLNKEEGEVEEATSPAGEEKEEGIMSPVNQSRPQSRTPPLPRNHGAIMENGGVHPLCELERLLGECVASGGDEDGDDALESLRDSIAGLIRLLRVEGMDKGVAENEEMLEPLLPSPEPLVSQFISRPVVQVIGASSGDNYDEERLTSGFWLPPPAVDDADPDMDQVSCDLVEVARGHLPSDFHLPVEVDRILRPREIPGVEGSSVGVGAGIGSEADDSLGAPPGTLLVKKRGIGAEDGKYPGREKKAKRPFVTPMRGRGTFNRPMIPQAGARGDPFRSRPPNTSRPPSLHVDDFVALEITGQQPTGPTGYNKLSMRAAKELMVTRNRGRGRAFSSDRGRFFSAGSTGQYNRREADCFIPGGVNNARGGGSMQRSGVGVGGAPGVRGVVGNPANLAAALTAWPATNLVGVGSNVGEVVVGAAGVPSPSSPRNFRTLNRSSDEKFGVGRGGWGGSGGRGGGKDRERVFGGGGRRENGSRHARSFTR
ncbi:protein virilizer homolog isoform X2 [Ischnura elegans]|uniref:protein virilizer homolog isoform X2 n=1 Tax=Ischnura elegans TaxID=197161 RepID=UPI001ED8BC1B|nr:protein virilizer homolog isoform X2 [Ischnura elegans]